MTDKPRNILKYAKTSMVDPFAHDAAMQIRKDKGAKLLLEKGCSEQDILLVMQALRIKADEEPVPPHAEFVATMPANANIHARPTAIVVREMLSGTHQQIIALGYEISDKEFIKNLHRSALTCPEIIVICDRKNGSAKKLADNWPKDCHPPKVYQDIEMDNAGPMASMHCKSLLVDGRDLLVTSANFTFHGHNQNIEFGVRLRGAQANEAQSMFIKLIQSEKLFNQI